MDRLTFDGLFCDIAICQEVPCKYPDTGCSKRQVWERLKEFEDIFGETYNLSIINDIVAAYRDGRWIKLPCKAGDKVYVRGINKVIPCTVDDVIVTKNGIGKYEILLDAYYFSFDKRKTYLTLNWTKRSGKDVFLSHVEADIFSGDISG